MCDIEPDIVREVAAENARLTEKIKDLEEALNHYGNERLYFPRGVIREIKGTVKLAPIYSDFGEVARRALYGRTCGTCYNRGYLRGVEECNVCEKWSRYSHDHRPDHRDEEVRPWCLK